VTAPSALDDHKEGKKERTCTVFPASNLCGASLKESAWLGRGDQGSAKGQLCMSFLSLTILNNLVGEA